MLFKILEIPVNFKLTNMMYINVAPKAIVDKNTKMAVKNFSVNQFSISELDKYKIFQKNKKTNSYVIITLYNEFINLEWF